eukprot:18623-Eustigmatos_ZCMA.PRE.1
MAQCPTELEGGPCYFRAYIAHGHMIQRHVRCVRGVFTCEVVVAGGEPDSAHSTCIAPRLC